LLVGVSKKIRLWWRLMLLLLFLKSAEKQVEQTLGESGLWRKSNAAGDKEGGSGQHAAPHALIGQLGTQRLLHPTRKPRLSGTLPGVIQH
jgi:hypothetical protein